MSGTSLAPGAYLAELRRSRGLSQVDLAGRLDVTRTLVSAWENGHRRPGRDHLAAMVELLGDSGRLSTLFERSDGNPAAPLFPAPTTATVVVHHTVDGLVDLLSSGPAIDGRPGYGWGHDLDTHNPVSALSTAYGLKTILIAGRRDWRVSLPRIRETLRRLELPGGGWSVGRPHDDQPGDPLPEVTAVVVSALHDAGESDEYVSERAAMVVNALHRDLGTHPASPYILATSLFELSRLPVDEGAARQLLDDLIGLALDGTCTWPVRRKESTLAPVAPSPVHTAIVVCALTVWARRLADDRIAAIAAAAADWLEEVTDFTLEDETLWREGLEGFAGTYLPVREFTPAWVVRALISAGRDANSEAVARALYDMFRYHLPDVGLWHWPRGGGMVPVWMAYNAVAALVAWAGAHEIV